MGRGALSLKRYPERRKATTNASASSQRYQRNFVEHDKKRHNLDCWQFTCRRKTRITQRSDGVWKVIAYQINLFFAVKFEFGIENSVRCEIEKLQKLRTENNVYCIVTIPARFSSFWRRQDMAILKINRQIVMTLLLLSLE